MPQNRIVRWLTECAAAGASPVTLPVKGTLPPACAPTVTVPGRVLGTTSTSMHSPLAGTVTVRHLPVPVPGLVPLVYVAPISESLTTNDYSREPRADNRSKIERAPPERKVRVPRKLLASMRRGACESTPASRSARTDVVASPLASHPGRRAVRRRHAYVALRVTAA